MASTPRQEMPPMGGFSSINYKRVFPKAFLKPIHYLGILMAFQLFGVVKWFDLQKKWYVKKLELKSAYLAIKPMMHAEIDRAKLKTIYNNREVERQLMSNIPNWEVGKYYNEPIYKTIDPKTWVRIHSEEHYLHTNCSKQRRIYRDGPPTMWSMYLKPIKGVNP